MILVPAEGQIAVVDDNAIERMIITRVLKLSNLSNPVVEFVSAVSFLEELDERSELEDLGVSLVLMDINMPVMTGFEALANIRVELGLTDLKIAMMVSSTQAGSDIARAKELGADTHFAKQEGIEKFVAEINANFANEAT